MRPITPRMPHAPLRLATTRPFANRTQVADDERGQSGARSSFLELLPDGLDLPLVPVVHHLVALLGKILVVDVRWLRLEVGPHTARELDDLLGDRARRALDLVLRRDR